VFNTDAQYFKTNNQMDAKSYPWMYYNQVQRNEFVEKLQPGDLLDAVKYDTANQKSHVVPSNAERSLIRTVSSHVEFLNDCRKRAETS
jgi:hypothetical protein